MRCPGGVTLMTDCSKAAARSFRGETWGGRIGPRLGLSQDIVQKVVAVRGPAEGRDLWGQKGLEEGGTSQESEDYLGRGQRGGRMAEFRGVAVPVMTRSGGPQCRGQVEVPGDDRMRKRRGRHVGGSLWWPRRTL